MPQGDNFGPTIKIIIRDETVSQYGCRLMCYIVILSNDCHFERKEVFLNDDVSRGRVYRSFNKICDCDKLRLKCVCKR